MMATHAAQTALPQWKQSIESDLRDVSSFKDHYSTVKGEIIVSFPRQEDAMDGSLVIHSEVGINRQGTRT